MGGGKSVWLCASAIRACLKWPGSRWYLCRHEGKTFRRTTLLTLERLLGPLAPLVRDHHHTDGIIVLRASRGGDSAIWYGGVGGQDDIEKIKSMELTGFGMDEASECQEDGFLMLSTRLRLKVDGVRYQGLLASNPEPGWVRHRFVDQRLADHDFIPALPRDNPNLPPGYEEQLRQLFEGNESWAKAYLEGDWDAFAGTNYVLAYGEVNAAVGRELDPVGDEVIGCDVARFGDDETVLVYRRGPVVMEVEVHTHQNTMQTAGHIVAMRRRHPAATVNVDAGGLGAGVVDALTEQGIGHTEVHFGGRALDPEHFADWASEAMAGALSARFRSGDISLPNDQRLVAQLTARQYAMTSRGQVKIESKDEMKKRGLSSPDRADALMLAFAPGRPQPWVA